MKTFTKLMAVTVALGLLLTNASVALAVPPLPSSHYGTVKLGGVNVPSGTLVSAWINGVKYAQAAVSIYAGDTTYSLNVPGDDGSTPGLIEGGRADDVIVFYVGDVLAEQTGIWRSGTNAQRNLTGASAHDVTPPVTTASVAGELTAPPDFYKNATVTLTPNEPSVTKYRLKPFGGAFGAWQTYIAPFSVSGEGANAVEFFSTDLAGNAESVKTLTVKMSTFPATGVLDTFNRRNGALGSNWVGYNATALYRIANYQVDVMRGGPIYWRFNTYGAKQEAYITLTTVDPRGHEQDLLFKVQGYSPDWYHGAIEVLYDARANAVRVETFRPGSSAWTIYPNTSATFQNGDRLGGRVLANGEVWIYRNAELLAKVTLSTADQAFFNSKGGRIGLWFIDAPRTRLDNFGGGNAP
jgi:hypothetical protein